MKPNGTAPGDYLNDQNDEYLITKTTLPSPRNMTWHMRYNDDLSQGKVDSVPLSTNYLNTAGNIFNQLGRLAKDVLSYYIAALSGHISDEIASKRNGTPINELQKEALMVIPNRKPESLQSTILQVGHSPL